MCYTVLTMAELMVFLFFVVFCVGTLIDEHRNRKKRKQLRDIMKKIRDPKRD